MLTKFDSWVQRGPFTALDLGVYRILYALCTLLILGDLTWITKLPDSLFAPPLGPFQLLMGFPPVGVIVTLEIARALALVLLGLGLWTRTMSVVVAILLLVTFGLTYSVGKIGHTILLVMAPLILSLADWGRRLSIDSMLTPPDDSSQRQWPLRLLALTIGLAFLSAASAKLVTGWLEFSTQATLGYLLRDHFTGGEDAPLTHVALGFNNWLVWESIDWITVIFEFALLAALLSWKCFRVVLAFATCFHLGVLLMFGIGFPNVIVYGAFVSWGLLAQKVKISAVKAKTALILAYVALAVVGVVSIWVVVVQGQEIPYPLRVATIYLGAGIGAGYLLRLTLSMSRQFRLPSGGDSYGCR